MIAICVTFRIKPGMMDKFMELILRNARAAVASEPGCHRFDVCSNGEDPQAVFLYEQYTDQEAFDAHRKTEHFLTFGAQSADLIEDKDVKVYGLVTEGG